MTTLPDFTITKLTVIDGQPNDRGSRLLATFDLHITGLDVQGCVLIESGMGIARACGPIGKTVKGHKASVAIADPCLQRAVTRRTAKAYSGLTGRELTDE